MEEMDDFFKTVGATAQFAERLSAATSEDCRLPPRQRVHVRNLINSEMAIWREQRNAAGTATAAAATGGSLISGEGGAIKSANAAASAIDSAIRVGGAGPSTCIEAGSRCLDLSLCRLTVVGTCFWEAIRAIDKLVEFRTPHQLIEFIPGLRLLFSLNAIERKQGRTDLIEAAVLEIVTLSCEEAYARFSREAQACDLESRCAKWRSKSVQCLVLDPDSIGVARDIQHLSVGNHGVLRQIDDTNRIARFCRSDQLGTTETVHLSTGESVSCTYTRTCSHIS
jgi:hypothetical protein